MNCAIAFPPLSGLHRGRDCWESSRCKLDILPWVAIAAGDRREHVLPFLCHDARADRVDEGMAEDRNEIVVLQDRFLDFFGQLPALDTVERIQVFLKLIVEILDAEEILRI